MWRVATLGVPIGAHSVHLVTSPGAARALVESTAAGGGAVPPLLAPLIRAASGGRITAVHLRDPGSGAALRRRAAELLRAALPQTPVLLHSDAEDPAADAAAAPAGLHLPWRALERAPAARRAALAGGGCLGVSCHSAAQALAAARAGASYAFLGSVWPTASHPGGEVGGTALISSAREELTAAGFAAMPVVAIGGVTAGNAAEAVRAGAAGVAAITSVLAAEDPAAAAAELCDAVAVKTLRGGFVTFLPGGRLRLRTDAGVEVDCSGADALAGRGGLHRAQVVAVAEDGGGWRAVGVAPAAPPRPKAKCMHPHRPRGGTLCLDCPDRPRQQRLRAARRGL
eukprot:TRINITY_DN40059_c0_g1_i3.p1 TRINITY_DN40059_c0_g1~~TRINITY_DN40059_c0_g1_i3.p1  ORF type:complete len:364 (+),score=71.77 TRINITY_DN40059_c0_g1_i3:71-1093(+)